MTTTISVVFIVVALLRMLIYVILSSNISRVDEDISSGSPDYYPTRGVSVIVIAKNEAEHLTKLLPRLISQDYPVFEIIVVDDFSSDNTAEVIKSFADSKVKYYAATRDVLGKKHAIEEAVAIASYEHLLFTDADTMPASDWWIALMMQNMTETNQTVIGYSPMLNLPGIAPWYAKIETLHTALLYLGAAKLGWPYMAVGRNWLYRKSWFVQSGGFGIGMAIPSGDDDLLIQRMDPKQVKIQIDPASWMYTSPKLTLASLFRQKSRHVSVAYYYLKKYQIALIGLALLHFVFNVLLLYGIFNYNKLILLGYIIFWTITIFATRRTIRKLGASSYQFSWPLFDIAMLGFNILLFIRTNPKLKSWN